MFHATRLALAAAAPVPVWEVARELRARVKAALDAAGVIPAGPDTIVITAGKELAAGAGADADAAPAPTSAPNLLAMPLPSLLAMPLPSLLAMPLPSLLAMPLPGLPQVRWRTSRAVRPLKL